MRKGIETNPKAAAPAGSLFSLQKTDVTVAETAFEVGLVNFSCFSKRLSRFMAICRRNIAKN
jgi:hypothetical protein